MYNFTNNWFLFSELRKELHKYLCPNKVNKILEIGSFEGASACYFSDYYLDMDDSVLICVDPFDMSDTTSPIYESLESIFLSNIQKSNNFKKITLHKKYSDEFFETNKDTFTFIYIDGSHELTNVRNDFLNAIKSIQLNGIIWLDDYRSSIPFTNLVNSLHDEHKDVLEIIHNGYQIAFRKVK